MKLIALAVAFLAPAAMAQEPPICDPADMIPPLGEQGIETFGETIDRFKILYYSTELHIVQGDIPKFCPEMQLKITHTW